MLKEDPITQEQEPFYVTLNQKPEDGHKCRRCSQSFEAVLTALKCEDGVEVENSKGVNNNQVFEAWKKVIAAKKPEEETRRCSRRCI